MAIIHEWVEGDFKLTKYEGEKITETVSFFMDKNLCTTYDTSSKRTRYEGVIESNLYGLMGWDSNNNRWLPYRQDVQELYMSWKAEQALLH